MRAILAWVLEQVTRPLETQVYAVVPVTRDDETRPRPTYYLG